MQRIEDYQRDLDGGVSGKIIHLTVDSWIDAPTQEDYDNSYDSYDGYRDSGLGALTNLHAVAADPDSNIRVVREFGDLEQARKEGSLAVIAGNEGGKILVSDGPSPRSVQLGNAEQARRLAGSKGRPRSAGAYRLWSADYRGHERARDDRRCLALGSPDNSRCAGNYDEADIELTFGRSCNRRQAAKPVGRTD